MTKLCRVVSRVSNNVYRLLVVEYADCKCKIEVVSIILNVVAFTESVDDALQNRAQTEQLKRRAYEERVRDIEHGTFTPLIFAATGDLAGQPQ